MSTEAPLPKSVVFATAGMGGVTGWVFIHPASTLAVRMNLASMQGKKFSFQQMSQQPNWILSLYDGLYAGMLRQVFYATSRYGLFEAFRDYLHQFRGKTDVPARIGVGVVSGGIAAYISCPMEVVVVRLANDSQLPVGERRNYKGVVDATARIIKEEGVSAFWRGSNPFVFRAMMVGIFQVATLDQFKELYDHYWKLKKDSIPNVFCAAMTTGLIYSVATMPLEASKNRMASQKIDPITNQYPYRGILQTLKKVAADEGFMSLYHGFWPYYVRCGGHTVAMFVSIQMFRNFYQQHLAS
ncbi:hypothetical protein ACA910_017738 [Epithemia clementina (nom. ined.)]